MSPTPPPPRVSRTAPLARIPVSRRTVLGAAAATPLLAWLASSIPAAAVAAHPSMLHTAAGLSTVADRVAAGSQPWTGGWDRLVANGRSSASWNPRPLETVVRGGDGSNYGQMMGDIAAAYQNALRWHIGGDRAHGDAAVRILNAWSGTLTTVTGNADRFLASGIYGYQWANAAELMRGYSGFDVGRFRSMLLNVFHPMCEHFLTNHNDAVITNYWANWDLCNMAAILSIGIFTDRDDLVSRALDYFENGAGNGSIEHAVPFVYDDEGLAQWQESGRDQAHSIMGIGLMGTFCEMAWHQGVDCYGYGGNRFLKAAEYVAKYNLGHDVPFTDYTWQSGPNTTAPHVGWHTHTEISSNSRGQVRPVWDMILGHYQGRRGLAAPWTQQIAESVRPDGGGGDYGPDSGGYDALGFTTLMHAPPTTVRIINVATGKCLDGLGRTTDGAAAGQWAGSSSANQRWVRTASGGYTRFRNAATGLYLDGMGRTADGAAVGQWSGSGSANQQWQVDDRRLRNRATGLYLDGMGRTTDGDDAGQWRSSTSTNQQWRIG
ncbi:RICIN domain-containing protein [Myceligenerans pegani]|uniref:RICIN domain-containing protein n=1 Tax=Myceligenerans pegani TaxID=2776917 RepID=A0ABR9MVV7_9MICO|nr:RICIN domain-containing protein [Myceligenerans sp. TRM 65318]MBE1875518.1 RICIN domain-containing protein [Myceligenerans sp. TRM 65318]MBE3017789.1 RICIN domain-containing protein [Myceligenerans sp. TRM 65318]